jgi:hypothetical protein
MDRGEKRIERSVFLRPCPVPNLRDGNRGAQQRSVAATQLVPAGQKGVIPAAGLKAKQRRSWEDDVAQ